MAKSGKFKWTAKVGAKIILITTFSDYAKGSAASLIMKNHEKSSRCRWFWEYLTPFTKFWGVFTSVVLYGVGVDILVHHHITGLYIILASLGLFLLEIAWVVSLFLKVCIQNEDSRIFSCWERVFWVKEWKKTIIYVAFAFGLLCKPHHLWLSSVAGIMLIILGLLHFLLTWHDKIRGYSKENLLDNQNGYAERLHDECDMDGMILKDENIGNNLKEDNNIALTP